MNSSPARKRNCGLSKLEREEQEVFMFTVCGPHLRDKQLNAEAKKKNEPKVRPSRLLAIVLQVWGRKIHLRKVLMEFDL